MFVEITYKIFVLRKTKFFKKISIKRLVKNLNNIKCELQSNKKMLWKKESIVF